MNKLDIFVCAILLVHVVTRVACSSDTRSKNKCDCSHNDDYPSRSLLDDGANGTKGGHHEVGVCSCPEHGCIPRDFTEYETLKINYDRHSVIRNKCLQMFPHLSKLYVSGFQYIVPGSFVGQPVLNELHLLRNFMHVMGSGVFQGLDNLTKLSADGCSINEIKDGAFLGLAKLKKLTLSNNTVWNVPVGAFSGLGHLTELDLSLNNIVKLKKGCFAGMTNLLTLNLSSNNIAHIERGAFEGLEHIQMIDLTNNKLQVLPHPSFFPGGTINMPKLKTVDLRGNPLRCDCRMNWLQGVIDNTMFTIHGHCTYPGEISRQALAHAYIKPLSQCKPNGSEFRIVAGTTGNLPCPIPDASWLLPNGSTLSEPGQRWEEYMLSNGDSLVIFDAQWEKHTGTYQCHSTDGDERLSYYLSVPAQPFRLTLVEWICIGVTLLVICTSTLIVGVLCRHGRPRNDSHRPDVDELPVGENQADNRPGDEYVPSRPVPSVGSASRSMDSHFSNIFGPINIRGTILKHSSGSGKYKHIGLGDSDSNDSGPKINQGYSV